MCLAPWHGAYVHKRQLLVQACWAAFTDHRLESNWLSCPDLLP
jgi:hypothetical protein